MPTKPVLVFIPHTRAHYSIIISFISHTPPCVIHNPYRILSFSCPATKNQQEKRKKERKLQELWCIRLPERRFPIAEQYSWQQCGWCWMLSRKHRSWLVQNGAGALRWMVCPYPRCWCRLRTSSLRWTHAVAKFKVHSHTYLCVYVHDMKSLFYNVRVVLTWVSEKSKAMFIINYGYLLLSIDR